MVRYEFSTNRILKNEDPISGIIDYMDSYLNLKPTDCVLYSENGHPFPMHKVSTYIHTSNGELVVQKLLCIKQMK